MVQVTHGQSQLSGWGHYAEPTALLINKTPDTFMVGDVIDLSATLEPGGTELHFSDGTVLSYRQSSNLLPALNNVTVWSEPTEGTTVPNDLDYVEIHASYITKHGKTIKAVPVKVPVAIPRELRVIVPEEPLIREGTYFNINNGSWLDGGGYRGYRTALHLEGVRAVVYWENSDGEIIATSEVTNPTVGLEVVSSSHEIDVPQIDSSQTITRYTSVEDEGSTITVENAMRATFSKTIGGVSLSATTYFKTDPIVSWGLFDLPTSYANGEPVTIEVAPHSKVKYKSNDILVGRYADEGNYWLPIFFRYLTVGGWYEYVNSQTVIFSDNASGDLWQYSLRTWKNGNVTFKVAGRHYSCASGAITWTNT